MKIEEGQRYEHNGHLVLVDYVDDEIHYRQWHLGEYIGMFRMPKDYFIKQLAEAGVLNENDRESC